VRKTPKILEEEGGKAPPTEMVILVPAGIPAQRRARGHVAKAALKSCLSW